MCIGENHGNVLEFKIKMVSANLQIDDSTEAGAHALGGHVDVVNLDTNPGKVKARNTVTQMWGMFH